MTDLDRKVIGVCLGFIIATVVYIAIQVTS